LKKPHRRHRSFVGGTVADSIGHGTFVAGEIAAIADNEPGSRASHPRRAWWWRRSSATTAPSRRGRRLALSVGPLASARG
jgi:hypothetical protein